MRVAWSLTRRSSTVVAGVLIAALEVWLAISSRTPGLNLSADLITGLSSASLYAGVLAAGFSAFEAGRWSSATAVHTADAARTPALVRLLHATTAALPIIGGYLLALVVLLVYAASTGSYGAPSLSWLTALGCALLAAAASGWLVGSVGKGRWWVAPAAALLFYGAYVALRVLPLPTWVQALYPVVLVQDFVFVRPLPATLLGMAGFAVGATVLVLLLLGGGWRAASRRNLVILSATASIIAGAGVVSAATTDGQYTVAFNPPEHVCHRGRVEICLNPGYRSAMAPLQRQIGVMNARAAGTPLVATRLTQTIEGLPAPQRATRSIYIEQVAGAEDIDFAIYRYVTQYGASAACQNSGKNASGARMLVDSWLSGYQPSDGGPDDAGHLRALVALPLPDGNAWFKRHYRGYFSCTLYISDLP